jgi:hypothetical protein
MAAILCGIWWAFVIEKEKVSRLLPWLIFSVLLGALLLAIIWPSARALEDYHVVVGLAALLPPWILIKLIRP